MPSRPPAATLAAGLTLLVLAVARGGAVSTDAQPPHLHLPTGADPPSTAGFWHRRVDVTLYAEAMCPYCCAWLAKRALEFDHELGGIAKLRVVPWGNARAAPGGAVTCQHGDDECLLNRMYACAIDAHSRSHWLSLLQCASAKYPAVLKNFDKCAVRAGINATAVRACAAGRRGDDLIERARMETENLYPQHSGVPWFVVERLPVGGNSGALGAVACAAWRGTRPAACYRPPPDDDGV